MLYQNLIDALSEGRKWLKTKQENFHTKLGFSIQKNERRIEKSLDVFTELRDKLSDDVEIAEKELCLTDPKTKVILYTVRKNEKGQDVEALDYTPENMKLLIEKKRNLLTEYNKKVEEILLKEVQMELYLTPEVPDGLTPYQIDVFKGVFIPKDFQYPQKNETQTSDTPN